MITGLDKDILSAYKKYMIETAVIFGANRKQAEQELNETAQFEMELAAVSYCICIKKKTNQ